MKIAACRCANPAGSTPNLAEALKEENEGQWKDEPCGQSLPIYLGSRAEKVRKESVGRLIKRMTVRHVPLPQKMH